MKYRKTTSRLFELILGVIGFVISIIAIILTTGFIHVTILLAIGSILALLSSIYTLKNNEVAGLGLVISAILILISASFLGVIGSLFILIAGVSALFRR